jgi:hypothetical protein
MKRFVLLAAVAALLSFQSAAIASTPPSHSASASCKAQLAASGTANFLGMFKTMGACISRMSKLTPQQRQSVLSAEKTCRAAQLANASAFEAKYGTNGKSGKSGSQENAFGKCVSQTAST